MDDQTPPTPPAPPAAPPTSQNSPRVVQHGGGQKKDWFSNAMAALEQQSPSEAAAPPSEGGDEGGAAGGDSAAPGKAAPEGSPNEAAAATSPPPLPIKPPDGNFVALQQREAKAQAMIEEAQRAMKETEDFRANFSRQMAAVEQLQSGDPHKALESLGLSWADMTKRALAAGQGDPNAVVAPITEQIAEMKAKLDEQMKRAEERERAAAEKEQHAEVRRELASPGENADRWGIIQALPDSEAQVLATQQAFRARGHDLTVAQSADYLEAYLVEEQKKQLEALPPKLRAMLGAQAATQTTAHPPDSGAGEPPASTQQAAAPGATSPPPTLSGDVASTPGDRRSAGGLRSPQDYRDRAMAVLGD